MFLQKQNFKHFTLFSNKHISPEGYFEFLCIMITSGIVNKESHANWIVLRTTVSKPHGQDLLQAYFIWIHRLD